MLTSAGQLLAWRWWLTVSTHGGAGGAACAADEAKAVDETADEKTAEAKDGEAEPRDGEKAEAN